MKPIHLISFLLCLSTVLSAAEPVVRDLGVPVKSVSWVRLHPGRAPSGRVSMLTPDEPIIDYAYGRGPDGGKPSLLISMGQNNGGLFVLDVDLATGHCRQYNAPSPAQQYPSDSFRSPHTGALYVGSAYDGHLLRYDPAHPGRTLEDLGALDPGNAKFPTGLDEAPDGSIWIGAWPNCSLTRFDPATGRFTQFGSMDGTDHYDSVLCGADGTIAALTWPVHPHLVLLNPKTGAHQAVGPWVKPNDKSEYIQLFKGIDGLLYLNTYVGKFRVHGSTLEPVTYLPLQMPGVDATYRHDYQEMLTMPGGLTAAWVDGADGTGMFRKLLITSTNPKVAPRTLDLDWHGDGSDIFMLHLGSDGLIYGSSLLPEHLFRCAPDGSGMVDLGRCSDSLGEGYTMGNFSNGTMAIASYVDSRISLYDPRRPYHYGTTAADNPRDLGRLDGVGLRPVAMAIVPALQGPDGRTVPERMWLGSLPYYGTWGGTLAWLDPKTGAHASHRNIVPDCTPFSLLWLPGLKELFVGISTECGTGAMIKARHGAFALWDPIADKPVYIGDFGLHDMANVLALVPAGGGRVYALIGHTPYSITEMGAVGDGLQIALLDPAARKVISVAPVPSAYGSLAHQGLKCLFPGPDGAVYGVTEHVLYRLKPGTCQCELVWRSAADELIDTTGPWIGRTFYFATGWRLRSLTLP